ncbi:MAG: hypothetical protein AAGF46_12020, partial [Pseudomonadota bacterium]
IAEAEWVLLWSSGAWLNGLVALLVLKLIRLMMAFFGLQLVCWVLGCVQALSGTRAVSVSLWRVV